MLSDVCAGRQSYSGITDEERWHSCHHWSTQSLLAWTSWCSLHRRSLSQACWGLRWVTVTYSDPPLTDNVCVLPSVLWRCWVSDRNAILVLIISSEQVQNQEANSRDLTPAVVLCMRPTFSKSVRSLLQHWNSVIPTSVSLILRLKSTGSNWLIH